MHLRLIRWPNAKLLHHVIGNGLTFRIRLTIAQDNLQFHELAQSFHVIEINTAFVPLYKDNEFS